MINVTLQGQGLILKKLDDIKSPALRRRVINKTARAVIKATKARTRSQTDITGKAFGPYSTNTHHRRPRPASGKRKSNNKMLVRLFAKLAVTELTADGATIGWRNSFEGSLAGKHHYGYTQTVRKTSLAKEKNTNPEGRDAPATRQQAKALLEAGFKMRVKGKAYKTPSIKAITQSLKIGQAGLILRILRGGSKDSWQTNIPARPTLGVSQQDIDAVAAIYQAEFEKALAGVQAA